LEKELKKLRIVIALIGVAIVIMFTITHPSDSLTLANTVMKFMVSMIGGALLVLAF
jgi:hypothetical protein